MTAAAPASAPGKRRPQPDDIEPILERVWEGRSLAAVCRELGLHAPSTCTWLDGDEYRERYARAREGRSDFLMEEGLTVTRASALNQEVGGKKVDSAGARAFVDMVKFAIGRMSSKAAPVQRVHISYGDLSDAEIEARLATLEAGGDADAGSEG